MTAPPSRLICETQHCVDAIAKQDHQQLAALMESLLAASPSTAAPDFALLLLQSIEFNFTAGAELLLSALKRMARPGISTSDYADLLEIALAKKLNNIAMLLMSSGPFSELLFNSTQAALRTQAMFDGLCELFKDHAFKVEMLDLLIVSGLKMDYANESATDSFVLAAVEADRPDILQTLIKYGGSGGQHLKDKNGLASCAYNICVQMGRLACFEVFRSADRMPINGAFSPYAAVLAALVDSPYLSEDQMLELAPYFMERGAHPLRQRYGANSALARAQKRKLTKLAEYLQKNYAAFGPAHVRRARQRKIKDICFHYSKANGFIYRIADFEFNFYMGGDHGGAYLISAAEALKDLDTDSRLLATNLGVEWFLPFLEKIAAGKEIDFDKLMGHSNSFSICSEDEISGWD